MTVVDLTMPKSRKSSLCRFRNTSKNFRERKRRKENDGPVEVENEFESTQPVPPPPVPLPPAFNYNPRMFVSQTEIGRLTAICGHCRAIKFPKETSAMCCSNGTISKAPASN